jgi:NADH-quinone oxidoreductase subunit K
MPQLLWIIEYFTILLLVTGLYVIIVSRNTIRILIGLELVTKAVTVLLIVAGYITGRLGLAQALVITLILVEVVVIVVAAGVAIGSFKRCASLNVGRLRTLKG